jgi:hypothetical protein
MITNTIAAKIAAKIGVTATSQLAG